MSNRLFDAVAAGARVVSDAVPGVEEVFGAGVLVVSGPEEIAELLRAEDLDEIFGDDDLRRRRAAEIAARHSFVARARTMLEDAAGIRARRGLA